MNRGSRDEDIPVLVGIKKSGTHSEEVRKIWFQVLVREQARQPGILIGGVLIIAGNAIGWLILFGGFGLSVLWAIR